MNYSWSVIATIAVLPLGACVIDKQLGDTEDDGASESTTDGPDDGGSASEGGTLSPSTGPAGPTTDDGGSDTTEGSSTETDGPALVCDDWAPPPIDDCEPDAGAEAAVTGDPLPPLADASCTVAALAPMGATTDALTLDCGDVYTLEITTDPHLALPFVLDQEVRLSATESFEPALNLNLPTFVIRSPEDALLLAYVNELDLELDLPFGIEFQTGNTGCAASDVSEDCPDGGRILAQRITLEFGDPGDATRVFDGNLAQLDDAGVSVIVEQAEQIVCWDEPCFGDDTGPFDRASFIVVADPA